MVVCIFSRQQGCCSINDRLDQPLTTSASQLSIKSVVWIRLSEMRENKLADEIKVEMAAECKNSRRAEERENWKIKVGPISNEIRRNQSTGSKRDGEDRYSSRLSPIQQEKELEGG